MERIGRDNFELIHTKEVSSFQQTSIGTLYLVATPIGNLSDMTYRAVETLRTVAIIAAEDTRQTQKLLNHFMIEGPNVVSYHEHNKQQIGPQLLQQLLQGQAVAVVTDAGTPGISDPGSDLVRLAIDKDIPVVSVPGACAAITALVASGMPTESFTFIGFLPRDRKQRLEKLEQLRSYRETLIFYESPHRIRSVLQDIAAIYPQRHAVLARELTKRFEAYTRGKLTDLVQYIEEHDPRGEYVIIVSGVTQEELETQLEESAWWKELNLSEHVDLLVKSGEEQKEAMKKVAKLRGISKREVYQAIKIDKDEDE